MKSFITFFFLAISLIAYLANATEIPPGPVYGDWFASGNPYNISGEIYVPEDSTLNIHEGVQVIFQGHHKLIINGYLEAIGAETDSILFTAADTSEGWNGIRFYDAPDSSHLLCCIIQYGHAYVDPGPYDDRGGGIFLDNSHPALTRCNIRGNLADFTGGGIYCGNSSNPSISDCTISGNTGFLGGGISCHYGSNPNISNCDISGNFSGDVGGGIDCFDSNPNVTNCTISGNASLEQSGGIGCMWGSNPTISNCTISGNTAQEDAGGIGCLNSNPNISNCTISGNTSGFIGGGIFCQESSEPTIENCTISENDANIGGGIDCHNSNPTINNCIIRENSALYGGGIFSEYYSEPTIENCTICENIVADNGGAIYFQECDPTMRNTIVEGNSGNNAIYFYESPGASLTYNDFYNNEGGNFAGAAPSGLGVIIAVNSNGDSCDSHHNIFLNPLFVDPANGNYHLQLISHCVDAGNPSSQYNDPEDPANPGQALWPALGTITSDIGAYGGQGALGWVGIKDDHKHPGSMPVHHRLHQNYPNPFNPTTTIRFVLPEATRIRLTVYDVSGRLVAELVNGWREAGCHQVTFDGSGLASGIYFVHLKAGDFTQTQKMILLK